MRTPVKQQFNGKQAIRKMQDILALNQECCVLAEQIGGFFGTALLLTTYALTDEAKFTPFAGLEADKIHIKLGMDSDRTCEALTHELLHGNLLREGFPWFDMRFESKVALRHDCVLNYVHHELMISRFESLGLDPRKFYAPTIFRDENEVDHLLKDPKVDFAFWCREWCAYWLTWRHTGNIMCQERIERTIILLQNRHPILEATTREIKNWFDRREYRDPTSFERAYNQLVSLMKMDTVDNEDWFRLERGRSKPIVRWNAPLSAGL